MTTRKSPASKATQSPKGTAKASADKSAEPIAEPVTQVTEPAKPAKAASKVRPVTCGQLFELDPEHGSEGCGRLPRHHGEHRPFLTLAATRKASRPKAAKTRRPKAAKVTRKDFMADIAAQVEAGDLSAGEALSKVAAFVSRTARPKAASQPVAAAN